MYKAYNSNNIVTIDADSFQNLLINIYNYVKGENRIELNKEVYSDFKRQAYMLKDGKDIISRARVSTPSPELPINQWDIIRDNPDIMTRLEKNKKIVGMKC